MNKYFCFAICVTATICGLTYAYTHPPINVQKLLDQGYIECVDSSLGSTDKGWTVKEGCNAYVRSMSK